MVHGAPPHVKVAGEHRRLHQQQRGRRAGPELGGLRGLWLHLRFLSGSLLPCASLRQRTVLLVASQTAGAELVRDLVLRTGTLGRGREGEGPARVPLGLAGLTNRLAVPHVAAGVYGAA